MKFIKYGISNIPGRLKMATENNRFRLFQSNKENYMKGFGVSSKLENEVFLSTSATLAFDRMSTRLINSVHRTINDMFNGDGYSGKAREIAWMLKQHAPLPSLIMHQHEMENRILSNIPEEDVKVVNAKLLMAFGMEIDVNFFACRNLLYSKHAHVRANRGGALRYLMHDYYKLKLSDSEIETREQILHALETRTPYMIRVDL